MQILIDRKELRRIRFFWFRLGVILVFSFVIAMIVGQTLLTSSSTSSQPTKVASVSVQPRPVVNPVEKPVATSQAAPVTATLFKFDWWMLSLFSPFILGVSMMAILMVKRTRDRVRDARWREEISPQVQTDYEEFKKKPSNFWTWNTQTLLTERDF